MGPVFCLTLWFGMLSAGTIEAAWAGSASIVSILPPRGAQQPFILIKTDHAIASVILFAGGNGILRLNRVPPPGVSEYDFVAGNFLVRTRQKFAAHDFTVAVVDASSDRQQGMGPRFRVSRSTRSTSVRSPSI
jgi:hypothetical protein